MRRLLVLASLVLAMAVSVRAEGTRSISSTADSTLYIRTANVGAGDDAEAVSLPSATGFQPHGGTFCIQILNEDTTAANGLLVQFSTASSVSASELTTPSDATLTSVQRIGGNLQPVTICGKFTGWIWQSELAAELVEATARVTW